MRIELKNFSGVITVTDYKEGLGAILAGLFKSMVFKTKADEPVVTEPEAPVNKPETPLGHFKVDADGNPEYYYVGGSIQHNPKYKP